MFNLHPFFEDCVQMKKTINVFLIFLFLTACALSPQTVKIDPDLKLPEELSVIANTRFSLSVTDKRKSPVLGQRGGVYKETAIIKTEGDITEKIRLNLIPLFEKAGYNIDKSAATRMNIVIVELTYQGYGEHRISEVEVTAKVSVTITSTAGNISKNFNASHKQEVLNAPSEEKNAELINDILSTVIQPVLNDKTLLDYIERNQ
jgi:uncharacterized lipoprotein